MNMNVPDPSFQITTLLSSVERKLTSKKPLHRHRSHAVISEKNVQGLVRQRHTLEFWSYLVAEVREREAGDVRVANVIQWDVNKVSNVTDIESEFFLNMEGADTEAVSQQACASLAHAGEMLVTSVAQMDIEQTLVLDQSEDSRKRRQREDTSRNRRLLRFLK